MIRFSLAQLAATVLITSIYAEEPQLEFTEITTRVNIVDITNAGDGSGRLFLVQRSGRIRIIDDGKELETPFITHYE